MKVNEIFPFSCPVPSACSSGTTSDAGIGCLLEGSVVSVFTFGDRGGEEFDVVVVAVLSSVILSQSSATHFSSSMDVLHSRDEESGELSWEKKDSGRYDAAGDAETGTTSLPGDKRTVDIRGKELCKPLVEDIS